MFKFLILSLFIFSTTQAKNQLEDLFVWKVSDELKLTVPQEKKFAEIMKSLGEKKNRLSHEATELLAKMDKNSSNTETLKKYRKNLEQMQKLSLEEFDEIRKLFGDAKASQYFKIKSDLTNKIKSLLVNEKDGGKAKKEALPPPKVIEEK